MRIFLKSENGYYVKGIQPTGAIFTNQQGLAHSFSQMPVHLFETMKNEVDKLWKCDLQIEFN